ncbi:hypothetical protein SAMN05216275_1225 [Streptosporangium canum]|uniref:Uncharacterized protein n=1 Tax=Streptosporangium canum TaxID=324952 RepID=A0A1I3YFV8_9ACTN|nr:hypothetical protein [Streptosporangium canum]SFK30712.1 hypothetical protein SAMN05216275_1225 [Streptosporangium canum]
MTEESDSLDMTTDDAAFMEVEDPLPSTSKQKEMLTDVESEISAELAKRGLGAIAVSGDDIELKPLSGGFVPRRTMPRSHVETLRDQLGWRIVDHPLYVGYSVPDLGFLEVALDLYSGTGAGRQLSKMMHSSSEECQYSDEAHPVRILPARTLHFSSEFKSVQSRYEDARIHLYDRRGDICIELSNHTPLFLALTLKWRNRVKLTLKVYLNGPAEPEDIEAECERVLHSFLYELNTRNGLVFAIRRRESDQDARRQKSRQLKLQEEARFPSITLQSEVATLFNLASLTPGNYPLAFLYYYQALEYFMSKTVRRTAIRDVRRILLDHRFNERDDEEISKLIGVVERVTNTSEGNQFRVLISECVREDEVVAFLKKPWNNHFANKGPIEAVPAIHLNNKTSTVLEQVADRVYKIRNRIVHAKDDPRFGDARVLLPQSGEAESLGPDVELVRLLAMEVILANQ